MLRSFSDHAANERTFLAWIRTGIAVLGFGFVIEKFNVFLLAIVSTSTRADLMSHLERLAGPLGRDEGLALMIVGVLIMLIGGLRYIRTDRLIDDLELRAEGSGRVEVLTAAGLALLASAFCVYLVLI
jgi:putative membrane protein